MSWISVDYLIACSFLFQSFFFVFQSIVNFLCVWSLLKGYSVIRATLGTTLIRAVITILCFKLAGSNLHKADNCPLHPSMSIPVPFLHSAGLEHSVREWPQLLLQQGTAMWPKFWPLGHVQKQPVKFSIHIFKNEAGFFPLPFYPISQLEYGHNGGEMSTCIDRGNSPGQWLLNCSIRVTWRARAALILGPHHQECESLGLNHS